MPARTPAEINASQRRPPNYSSRKMQVRLLLLVASLMLVFVMMDEARKPENWMWMGFPDDAEAESASDERLAAKPDPQAPQALADLFSRETYDNSLVAALSRQESSDDPENLSGASSDYLTRTLFQVWQRVFEGLTNEQRVILFESLGAVLQPEPLPDAQSASRSELAQRIDALVAAELASYRQLGDTSPEASRPASWETLLDEVAQRFQAFTSMLRQGRVPDDATVGDWHDLQQAQALLTRIALDQVEDHSLGSRREEQFAWYRMFEKLERPTPPEHVADVTVFELSETPDRYRGRYVRLVANARRIKAVTFPNNRAGFRDYWELWLRPKTGPDLPICVMARELPEGFPAPSEPGSERDVDEPIVVRGIFFKNLSYRAPSGLRVAPLILAQRFDWQAETADAAMEPTTGLNLWSLLFAVILAAVGACGVAWWVARVSRKAKPSQDSLPPSIKLGGVMAGLVATLGWTGNLSGQISPSSLADEPPPWLVETADRALETRAGSIFEWFEDLRPSELDRLGDFNRWDPNEPIIQTLADRLTYVRPEPAMCALLDEASTWWQRLREDPTAVRGDFVSVRGRIRGVREIVLTDATWESFERDALFEVELEVPRDGGESELVWAWVSEIPEAWKALDFPRDEGALRGIFLHVEQRESLTRGTERAPLLLGTRMQWFPQETAMPAWIAYWSRWGFDAGLWEIPARHEGQPLTAADGECFYPWLAEVAHWDNPSGEHPPIETLDLFQVLKDPNEHRGTLYQLDGQLKRVTEISTGQDVFAEAAGLPTYYQIDLLVSLEGRRIRLGNEEANALVTNQYPVTLCATALPPGVTVGDQQNVRVRVIAGFYRNWKFSSEYLRRTDERLRQLSPLAVVARWETVPPAPDAAWLTQVAIGMLVVMVVLSVGGFAYLRWTDRRYAQRRRQARTQAMPETIALGTDSESSGTESGAPEPPASSG